MGITEQLADFVVGTEFQDLPYEAIERAKQSILGCLGVTLAGAVEPVGQKVTKLVANLGGVSPSTVITCSFKALVPDTALANGTMAHALDYDNTSPTMTGHPSAPVVPTILALGEAVGVSGSDILRGYILGVEVEAKIGAALNPGLCDAGWHSTDVLGSLGHV